MRCLRPTQGINGDYFALRSFEFVTTNLLVRQVDYFLFVLESVLDGLDVNG